MTALATETLTSGYGKVQILDGVSIAVGENEIVGILGHNGMGKTTLLKTLMGIVPIWSGKVWLQSKEITGASVYVRARGGLGYVPQGRGIFPGLSVRENLLFPQLARRGETARELERVLNYFPRLRNLQGRPGRALSGGEQQLLALARALISRPSVLLLDEPTEGIQPSIIEDILAKLTILKKSENLSVIVVEQNLHFIRSISDRVLILQKGKIVKEVLPVGLTDELALVGIS